MIYIYIYDIYIWLVYVYYFTVTMKTYYSGLHSLHIWSTSKLILAPLDASLELLYYAYSIIIHIKT